ncbi:mannitol dehydrogenase [Maricaulis sp. W15]|uniref:mannitol dehydrogenase family protein n=1 Tax=Maricaulis sp. W15 TaxID=1772333 RepID=UPI000948CDF0|nr:mannitol dehydrogenase family protein [Maricaulis sp. W15]OLF75234.1 mannitol dehydrogenase [Maricaulis sp. W15]
MRLQADLIAGLPKGLARPGYDRSQPVGIVHLGLGAFHRAHQAVCFDALMAAGETGWMIRGASLRSPRVAGQLNPQDGLYTCQIRDADGERRQIIGAIRDVLVAPDDPAALVAAMAHPDTALVTLTVTEKGYLLDPQSGALMLEAPEIRADLADAAHPRSVPGLLVAALAARRVAGLPPFTALSCDNIPDNGRRTRQAVLAFAHALDPDLAGWIETEAAFPSSMVDRIVPATTAADIDALEASLGYRDEAMVKTEGFTQWVVEDWFSDRRPPLESVGVEMTDDVAAWERIKLRLLNGSHSTLAYLGALAGHRFVHEAMAAPGFDALVNAIWDEAQSTLDAPAGFNAAAYRAALVQRFANPALEHSLVQIAMDGSQKLPQRLLATLRDRLAVGLASPAICLAIAAWMRWQTGVDEQGRAYDVDDPLADRTHDALARAGADPAAQVQALLAIEPVFGRDLARRPDVVAALTDALAGLLDRGAARCVAAGLARPVQPADA